MIITCGKFGCNKETYSREDDPFTFCPFCSCRYRDFGVYPEQVAREEIRKQETRKRAQDWTYRWLILPWSTILIIFLCSTAWMLYSGQDILKLDSIPPSAGIYIALTFLAAVIANITAVTIIRNKKFPGI